MCTVLSTFRTSGETSRPTNNLTPTGAGPPSPPLRYRLFSWVLVAFGRPVAAAEERRGRVRNLVARSLPGVESPEQLFKLRRRQSCDPFQPVPVQRQPSQSGPTGSGPGQAAAAVLQVTPGDVVGEAELFQHLLPGQAPQLAEPVHEQPDAEHGGDDHALAPGELRLLGLKLFDYFVLGDCVLVDLVVRGDLRQRTTITPQFPPTIPLSRARDVRREAPWMFINVTAPSVLETAIIRTAVSTAT